MAHTPKALRHAYKFQVLNRIKGRWSPAMIRTNRWLVRYDNRR